MKDRIAHIMRAKNLKASDFASLLGIQPSAVSHILAGRNKPSLEIVRKIKETFPEYNLDWIVFGTGPMTTSEPFKVPPTERAQESADASQKPSTMESLFDLESSSDDTGISTVADQLSVPVPLPAPVSEIRSIVIFYEDGTFESFLPKGNSLSSL